MHRARQSSTHTQSLPANSQLSCSSLASLNSRGVRKACKRWSSSFRSTGTARGHLQAVPEQIEGWSLFDNPELCDAAFAYRDFDAEVEFLEDVFEEQLNREPKSFLELGCGAANHAIRLAKRGHTVYALDTSRPQLQYARRKAEVAGAAVRFMREDMFDFELPDGATVDVAMLLLGTAAHLHTHADVETCWRATRDALAPGGLFVIEVQHPETVFDGSFARGEMWEAPLPDGRELVMEYGTDDDQFDAETQLLRRRIGVSVRSEDDIDLQGEGYIWQRVFTLQELQLLAERVGFEVAALYGDLSLEIGFLHPEASRLVLVLQNPFENSNGSSGEALVDV